MVSAQFLETVYVIDLGVGTTPLSSAKLMHDPSRMRTIEDIPGSSPKMVFVPKADKQQGGGIMRQRSASVGLLDAARERMREMATSSDKIAEDVASLQSSMSSEMKSTNSKMQVCVSCLLFPVY
jgi:hypothetical protein